MGAAKSKPMREAPVRFVAKKLPKVDNRPMEIQFKKPEYSAQGINKRQDDVNTEPLMYVETAKDGTNTEITDHVAPRWYMNTYLELMDNQREDRVIISGNLPLAWERDKFEPYSLVRGRIDEEDLDWVLSPEARKMPMDELVQHTKLERHVLQDILDTVEVPRRQYRNYKGKLHKAIDDANTHLTERKIQMEKAKEAEVLRRIGYSEEDVKKEEQYLTNRTRGVKVLDDLGVSIREKQRKSRAAQQNEMEELLEQRRMEQLETGTYQLTQEEIHEKPETLQVKVKPMHVREQVHRNIYRADMNKDDRNQAKFEWWLDRTRRIRRGTDKIHGVPLYNDRLAANDDQTRTQMREAAEFNFSMSRAQGAKGFTDPRGSMDDLMGIMRDNKDEYNTSQVEVHEEDGDQYKQFQFPHTKGHAVKPKVDKPVGAPTAPPPNQRVENDFEEFFARLRAGEAPPSYTSRTGGPPPRRPPATEPEIVNPTSAKKTEEAQPKPQPPQTPPPK